MFDEEEIEEDNTGVVAEFMSQLQADMAKGDVSNMLDSAYGFGGDDEQAQAYSQSVTTTPFLPEAKEEKPPTKEQLREMLMSFAAERRANSASFQDGINGTK